MRRRRRSSSRFSSFRGSNSGPSATASLVFAGVCFFGGLALIAFAPKDSVTVRGLRGFGEVQSGGTVISLRQPLMSNLWRRWRNMLQSPTGPRVGVR
jgi:hypothetical protein